MNVISQKVRPPIRILGSRTVALASSPHSISRYDPAHGCDAGAMAETVRTSREARVKYTIWNRRICSALDHISVKSAKASDDSVTTWLLPGSRPESVEAASDKPQHVNERPDQGKTGMANPDPNEDLKQKEARAKAEAALARAQADLLKAQADLAAATKPPDPAVVTSTAEKARLD